MPFLCLRLLDRYIYYQLCYLISVTIDLLAVEAMTVSNVFDENHTDVLIVNVSFQDTHSFVYL